MEDTASVKDVTCTTGSPPHTYSIVVGSHALDRLAQDIRARRPASVAIISDSNVWRHHGERVQACISAGSPTPPIIKLLPPGEASKSRGMKAEIEDWMLSHKCLRDTLVVGVGGGVVGDLAGFIAATYMRGVSVAHVPTTVLAMVDSAIGGKTGLDVPAGKNLIGAFHQPIGVYADPAFLRTLPRRECANGFAEIIKAAAIGDAALFDVLEEHTERLLQACADSRVSEEDTQRLAHVLRRAMQFKAEVVSGDEREGGRRAILNFGHTIGHAIEAIMQPRLLHGECVAIGMVKEAEAARALGHASSAVVNRVRSVCKSFGLPVTVPEEISNGPSYERCLEFMLVDKKNTKADGFGAGSIASVSIRCVMLRAIGELVAPPYTHAVPGAVVERLLSAHLLIDALPPPKPEDPVITVRCPGSKSLSNRCLLMAALARGETSLRGLLISDDTQVMMACLRTLGADIDVDEVSCSARVRGIGDRPRVPPAALRSLYVQNAGTASRFLTAVLSLLQPSADASDTTAATPVILRGNSRMHERPIGPLVDALRAQGARIEYLSKDGCLPLAFHQPVGAGDAVASGAQRRMIRCAAKISSQYVSALLMAAPYFPPVSLEDDGHVELVLDEEQPTSLPYILMTIASMREFGVDVAQLAPNRFLIPRGRTFTPPAGGTFEVEADASSASYPAAIAAATGHTVILDGIGRTSTQGDAGFAPLLRGMGCDVIQEDNRTVIRGPGRDGPGLRALGTVNMAEMTDTFMTLAAVAALADGTTRIEGIANQRVKECDRISATTKELRKCGVIVEELPDGLVITGHPAWRELASVGRPASRTLVHCYDDHRIAMSFAVLATVRGGVVVDEPACVEKTYPEFWDHLSNLFHASVRAGHEDAGSELLAQPAHAILILVGMRGAGKSSLGQHAASLLGRRFVDLDREMERVYGEQQTSALGTAYTVSDIVAAQGWDGFRALELKVLRAIVDGAVESRVGVVVSCGGGIVETEAARAALLAYITAGAHVVEIRRSVADIERDLARKQSGGDTGRPAYPGGASLADVYERRKPWYASCSSQTFEIMDGDTDWAAIAQEFADFVLRVSDAADTDGSTAVCGASWPSGSRRSRSWDGTAFVCVSVPHLGALTAPALSPGAAWTPERLTALGTALKAVCEGSDALELRVDYLADQSADALAHTFAILRRALRNAAFAPLLDHAASTSTLNGPLLGLSCTCSRTRVVATVRSIEEGGRFEGSAQEYCRLLETLARLGADFVDVEVGRDRWPITSIRAVCARVRRLGTRVIASAHWPSPAAPPSEELLLHALHVSKSVRPAVYKFIGHARSPDDVAPWQLHAAALKSHVNEPVIALLMGPAGSSTRVLNTDLTPVTHAALPVMAAPGQLSVTEIRAARLLLGCVRRRFYCLFGTPISASLSPLLHNTAFACMKLPHAYDLFECATPEEITAVVRGTRVPPGREGWFCGGGNVTIPHKVAAVACCDSLSPSAMAIGAVNTLIALPQDDGTVRVHGDNTDWVGISWPLKLAMTERSMLLSTLGQVAPTEPRRPAALIVGAGGTAAAAVYAIKSLGLVPVILNRTAERADELASRFDAVAVTSVDEPTCGGACPSGLEFVAIVSTLPGTAEWTAPSWLLAKTRPVAFDVNYRAPSKFMEQARAHDCVVVHGLTMLVAQAAAANALWTGRLGAGARHAHELVFPCMNEMAATVLNALR